MTIEQMGERSLQILRSAGQRFRSFQFVAQAGGLAADVVEGLRERLPFLIQVRPTPNRLIEPDPSGDAAERPAQGAEEILGRLPQRRGAAAPLRRAARAQCELFRIARQFLDLCRGDLRAEVLRRHLLKQMRLVEDDPVVVGQHGAVGRTDRKIGEEQMMVDHYQLRLLRLALETGKPAALVFGAAGAGAGVRPGVDVPPELQAVRQFGNLGAVAALGFPAPFGDPCYP